MESVSVIINFIKGIIVNTEVGPFIVILAGIYAAIKIKEYKQKKKTSHLQKHATIKGRQIFIGSGISIRLESTNGWRTGVFLGANQNGHLIIKTEENSKILVDPNFITDVRIFDPY